MKSMTHSSQTENSTSQPSYKLEVDKDKCISAASCIAIAPQTFQLDDQEKAEVICQRCEDAETQLLAAQSCPTQAIKVTDEKTGQQVWPK